MVAKKGRAATSSSQSRPGQAVPSRGPGSRIRPKHYPRNQYTPRTREMFGISFPAVGRTKQSFKDECDINLIVKNFTQTGEITHVNNAPPRYGDASIYSFDESMRIVAEANSRFEELPSDVRRHFENSPAKFLDAVHDPERVTELRELGLMAEETPPAELPLQAISEPEKPPTEVKKDLE